MRILILGAGRTGSSVAESLANESNEITVVEQNPKKTESLRQKVDLRVVIGDAQSPRVLQEAGINDADLVIATTANDMTNLAVCLMAAKLFHVPTRIARVRNHELFAYDKLLTDDGFQATSTIWPEQAICGTLLSLSESPEALQIIDFADRLVSLVVLSVEAQMPIVGHRVDEVRTVTQSDDIRVVALYRNDHSMPLDSDLTVEPNDELVAFVTPASLPRLIEAVHGKHTSAHSMVIGGNASLGLQLAQALEGDGRDRSIRILEPNRAVAEAAAERCPSNTLILEGDYTNEGALQSAGIDTCELFMAVGISDQTNILAALLAKKLGAKRVVALVEAKGFTDLALNTPIDSVVSGTEATLGEIIHHVRHGDVEFAHGLRRGAAEVLEIVVHGTEKTSSAVGRTISKLSLPECATIGALVREVDGKPQILMARPDTVIQAEDHVIVYVGDKHLIPKVEKCFAVNLGFF